MPNGRDYHNENQNLNNDNQNFSDYSHKSWSVGASNAPRKHRADYFQQDFSSGNHNAPNDRSTAGTAATATNRSTSGNRNTNRQVVQSDELSSTSGAAMWYNGIDPHASQALRYDLPSYQKTPTNTPLFDSIMGTEAKNPLESSQLPRISNERLSNTATTRRVPDRHDIPRKRKLRQTVDSKPAIQRDAKQASALVPEVDASATAAGAIHNMHASGEVPYVSTYETPKREPHLRDATQPQQPQKTSIEDYSPEAYGGTRPNYNTQNINDYSVTSGRYKPDPRMTYASNQAQQQPIGRHAMPPEATEDNAVSHTTIVNGEDSRGGVGGGISNGGGNGNGSDHYNFTQIAFPSDKKKPRRKGLKAVVIILIFLVAAVGGYFGFQQLLYAAPVDITVNGEKVKVEGNERSINGLLDANIVSVTPGNYVAVDNSVLKQNEGTRCTASINGGEVTDLNTHLNEGDEVVITNGSDIMEEYTDGAPEVIPTEYEKIGTYGALHVFLPGQDGEKVSRTGKESGITTETVTKEKINDRLVYYSANTNGEKVIALTFDDGPWPTTTQEILDILDEYNAKATFYTIGQQISDHSDQVKRMQEAGHEIATHTWDHAAGSGRGVSLNYMSTQERIDEVTKGMQAIKDVTGADASVYFRAPGGNFAEEVATDLKPYVQGEIGWNIDTEDWRRPGAATIASRIKSAQPGNVILMHDGGGDRSQTVAALREGLAYLSQQGYEFVTISELIERYPYTDESSSKA